MTYTDEELRIEATNTRDMHDPAKQSGSTAFPGRCELCHYTRHPCDAYDMADAVLALLVEKDDARRQARGIDYGPQFDE